MRRFYLLILFIVQINIVDTWAQVTSSVSPNQKLQLAEYLISHFYVDKVDENKIVETAIMKMLEELDPHSTYANPDEVKSFNESIKGDFEGIGIRFQMLNDTLIVKQTIKKGPSMKAGLLPGDRIVSVNGTNIAGVKMKTDSIMKLLRGSKGSLADLTVIRRGCKDPLRFKVSRDKIPIKSIDAAYMLTPTLGYIKINRFALETGEEFEKALDDLKSKGMQDLVLDLQYNGGGLLKSAIDIANDFLSKGDLIVYTKGRTSSDNRFFSKGNGKFQKGRLVVLINEYSASASEIVSGAIQDWDRGVLIGRRSFGKGLVQRPFDLPDGSMIRLTIARYYTPSGRCIQKPYDKNSKEMIQEYEDDLNNRYKHGEFMHADSIHFVDSLKAKTKILDRTVYGGGGIMPDIFVAADTVNITPYLKKLIEKGVINQSVAQYTDMHRDELKRKYPLFNLYKKNFKVDEELLKKIQQDAEASGVRFDEKQYIESLQLIKNRIKELIAFDLWDTDELYMLIGDTDESLQKAKEILKNGEYEKILSRK